MSIPNFTLPDQIPDPDWCHVKELAASLLETCITEKNETLVKETQDICGIIGEEVLAALYGPHVDDIVQELRERYGPQD
jgi:hypothetical protein